LRLIVISMVAEHLSAHVAPFSIAVVMGALDAIKLHLPDAGATFGSPFMIPPNAP